MPHIYIDGEERKQFILRTKILAADSKKQNKMKRHLETLLAGCFGRTASSKPLLASFEVAYRTDKV
jgi:hypothetical protein